MFCRLLGPLEVRAGDDWALIGAPKWRALLATLLLHPGQVVSTPQLTDELWGTDPPPGARKLVSGYVARLRQLIGDPDGRVLVTAAPGYRLLVARAELDITQFERLVAEARSVLDRADGERASELLAEALALWRGPALADVPSGPLIAAEAARLEELRLDALELRVEAEIRCGRAAEVIAQLRHLAARYPLRERFWHQLMRALEQGGRAAEALEAYAQAQQILADELGADPGSELQRLHRRLLAGEPAPASRADTPAAVTAISAAGVAPAGVAVPAVLRQLPTMAACFTGRARELTTLTRLIDRARADLPGAVVIAAIDGMPGVGKTALAVQAGHLMADQFPDRQLFVDLHGHTPGQEPADPAEVLAALLAASGVDPGYLPASLDGRSAMWRGRMAGQRALLILDNAAGSAQVEPLLPGTAGCLVLVTSRRFLGDLTAALEVPLDVLSRGDAQAMFTELAPRSADYPDQVAELAELCGRLPLAISLAARLFTRHRSWTMADLIGQTRARLLTVTAEHRTIAAAFEASYEDLDSGRQRFFRYLGLHPGPEIDAFAAAALAGLSPVEAAAQLDALYGDRLLEEPVPRRYRLHDLIRQYARSLAASDSGAEHERAVDRLLDYYQHTALAADLHFTRRTRSATSAVATAPKATPSLPDRPQAQGWMAAERVNLIACIDHAIASGDHARAVGLIASIAGHLRAEGPWSLAVTLHTAAIAAARHLGDHRGLAGALLNLGDLQWLTSETTAAEATLAQASDLYRAIGDPLGEANALYCLGIVAQHLAEGYPRALELTSQALDSYRAIGDRLGEAHALAGLGIVRRLAGDFPGAVGPLERALEILRELGNRSGEANALRGLAAVRQLTGDYPGAASLLEQALEISRDIADQIGEAYALFGLGAVRQLTGDYPSATTLLQQALRAHNRIGSRRGEAYACVQLGDTRRAMGDLFDAARLLETALDICRELGDRPGEAYALVALGRVRRAAADYPEATELIDLALEIFRHLGDQGGEVEALNETGALLLAQADPMLAGTRYKSALALARTVGAQLEEARALEGLGRCAPGDAADLALHQALAIYQRLGTIDAARLQAELDAPLAIAAPVADSPASTLAAASI